MNTTANDAAGRVHAGARKAFVQAPTTDDPSGTPIHDAFDALVADAENLMSHTVDAVGNQAASARAKLRSTLVRTKEQIGSGAATVAKQSRMAAKATDVFVHDRPWQAVGIAAVLGLAIGALLARR